ncbi:unnamed protein product [Lathyrus oleraceus]
MNNAVATSIVFSDESFVYLDPTHPEHVETQQKNNSFSNSQKNLEISYYHDSLVKQLFIQEMSTRVTLSKKKNRRSRRIRYRFHLVEEIREEDHYEKRGEHWKRNGACSRDC